MRLWLREGQTGVDCGLKVAELIFSGCGIAWLKLSVAERVAAAEVMWVN